MARLHAQPRFQRVDERLEEIEEQRARPAHDRAQVLVDEGGKDYRLRITVGLGLDARETLLGFLGAVDEGQGNLIELDALELREQAVAEHLRGDARAIGDEKHCTALHY